MQEGTLSTESYEADFIAKQTLLATGSGVWKWNAKDFKEVGDHAVAGMICSLRGADLASPCGGLLDVLRADDRERLLAKLELASTKGKSFHLSATVIDMLGSAKVLTLRGAPLPDDPDTIVALCFLDEPCDSDHFSICPKIPAQCASVIDSAVDAIVTKSLTGEITSWNRAAEALFGYSQQEVIGKSVTILIPASRQHEEVEILSRLGRGERILNYESIRLHKSGDPIHVSLTISPIFDSQGAIVGASKIVRNITDRMMATEELRLSEQRLRFAISSVDRGIWDFNVQTGEVLISPLYSASSSEESSDFRGTQEAWFSVAHPEDIPMAKKSLEDYLQGKTATYSIECRQGNDQDGWKWVHSCGKIVEHDSAGQPLRMVGTYADITGIKLAEGDLLLKEAAIDSSQAAIVIADQQGHLTYVNPAFLRMWGFNSVNEVIGRKADEFRWFEGASGVMSLEEFVRSGAFHGEFIARRSDGTAFDAYAVANAVAVPGGGRFASLPRSLI
jgi:PAS domain S-box-containing protein